MNDLQKKSVEELKKLEEESRAELFALKFQAAMGSLEKSHRISELRKQIARILTVLSTYKKNGENINVNVKVNLNETYSKIEKESQAFMKEKRAQFEKMMAEKKAQEQGNTDDLLELDLPLDESSDEKMPVINEIIEAPEVNLEEQKPKSTTKKPKTKKGNE